MIIGAILVCEVAFWVFLVAGLATRYLAGRARLGAALLLGSPLADLGLLALTAVDLHRGAPATQAHALAAIYVACTVAFGRSLVDWADRRFAHRFAGGPRPARRPRSGAARVAHEWREFGRAALAWGVSGVLLGGLSLLAGDPGRARVLLSYVVVLSLVLVVWFATGPVPAVASARRRHHGGPLG